MIIIYHCSGGAHSSILAAHIHLDILPSNRIPGPEEILQKTNFDQNTKVDWGLVKPIGTDTQGNLICTMGRRFSTNIVIQALNSFHRVAKTQEEFQLINIHPNVNFLMKIGGMLSRGFGCVSIGRPIVIHGSLKAYPNIVEVVSNVKQKLKIL